MFSETLTNNTYSAAKTTGFEEEDKLSMGSRNHSYVQACLTIALSRLNEFVLFTELSLDIDNKEYKPDLCAYSLENDIDSLARDVLKVQNMPLLVIEILSPRQSIEIIMEKFDIYFQAGVQSCWMVIPSGHTVLVYSSLNTVRSFSEGNIIDDVLGKHIPIKDVFKQIRH